MGVNIRQLAKIAGVSVATISRATNPETRNKVAPDTLERIDRLIKRHGYTPNIAARHLSRQKTKMIGVIMPYDYNIFYSSYHGHILAGVSNFFIKSDYQFKLILLHEREDMWDNYNFKMGEGVEGIILTHWFRFFSKKMISEKMDAPCVVINDFDKDMKARFVCEDGRSGGKRAAEYLCGMGHRNVAVITGAPWSRDSAYRREGFTDSWKKQGLSQESVLITQGHFDDINRTHEAVDAILKAKEKATAIFCCNDNMAFWAIERLRQKGLSCPQDISVIGYDDDFRCATFDPPLTTMQVPVYDMAQRAAKIVLEYLESGKPSSKFPKKVEWVPVRLIERRSTRRVSPA